MFTFDLEQSRREEESPFRQSIKNEEEPFGVTNYNRRTINMRNTLVAKTLVNNKPL